jgi:hypothetical protein
MTYGRVRAAGPNDALDGAAVSHLAELVRGDFRFLRWRLRLRSCLPLGLTPGCAPPAAVENRSRQGRKGFVFGREHLIFGMLDRPTYNLSRP